MANKSGAYGANDQPVEESGAYSPNDRPAEDAKSAGALRKVADVGLSLVQGAAGGARALADAAGAGNKVSGALDSASKWASGAMSPERQAEVQARSQRIKEAEAGGSLLDEAGAYMGGLAEAPVSTIAQGVGSIIPTMAAALLTKGKGAPMAVGAVQGAGAVKGSIYDAVKEAHEKTGMAPEQAEALASKAQEYTGPNAGNIAAGAGLGIVAGSTGVEHALVGRAASKGALRRIAATGAAEGITEGAQGGQERYSSNVAQQAEGFDVPAYQGVAGQSLLEGTVGVVIGGGVGAVTSPEPAQQPQVQPQQVPNVAPVSGPIQVGAKDVQKVGAIHSETQQTGNTRAQATISMPENVDRPAVFRRAQAMGIRPNAGPMSAAAAVAVETGATDVAQHQQLQTDADEEFKNKPSKGAIKKTVEPKKVDPPAPALTRGAGPLSAALFSLPSTTGGTDAQGQAQQGQAAGQPGAATDAGATRPFGQDATMGAPEVPAPVPATSVATTNLNQEASRETKGISGAPQARPGETIDPETGEITLAGPAPDQSAAPTNAGAKAQGKPPAAPTHPLDLGAHTAATSPHNERKEPSDAQKDKGNYQKGHLVVSGLPLSIENPEGSTRRARADAPVQWETKMVEAHYGDAQGSVGMDGDPVDVFIKPGTPLDYKGPVYVIDQVDPATGKPDEHKAMVGYESAMRARLTYMKNYQRGWKGFKAITPMAWDEFKTWVRDADKTKVPAALAASAQSESRPPAAPAPPASAAGVAPQTPPRAPETAVQPPPTPTAGQGAGSGQKAQPSPDGKANLPAVKQTKPVTPQVPPPLAPDTYTPPAAPTKDRWENYEIVDAPQAGKKLVREPRSDGSYQNLATFTPGRGSINFFFESPSTRTPIEKAINRWSAENQKSVAAPAPTGEAALYSKDAEVKNPATLDELIGAADAGYRVHFDYAGTDGRTMWLEKSGDAWVMKAKDDGNATTWTKGGAGVAKWTKAQALREASDQANYRFNEWKPLVATAPKPAEDLNAMFNELLAEEKAKDAAKTAAQKPIQAAVTKARRAKAAATASAPKPERTATAAAVSAAKNTGDALGNAIDGLGALFGGGPGKFGSGLSFDEDTYAKAKPLFQAAIANLKDAAADLKEAMRTVIRMVLDKFGADTAAKMQPYVVRFIQDMRVETQPEKAHTDGEAPNDPATQGQGGKPLGDVPTDKMGGAGDGRPGGPGVDQGGDRGGKADSDADAPGLSAGRSGGDGVAGPDLPASGGERPGRGVSGGGGRTRGRVPGKRGPADVGVSAGSDGAGPEQPVAPASVPAANFEIDADLQLGSGGETVKYRDNLAAIHTLKKIEAEHRRATAEEKRILARYVGWGSLPNAFRNPVTGAFKEDWLPKIEELEALLTPKEIKAARASTPNAHYTSSTVVDFMWRAAQRLGFGGGLVLESSVGSGNFIGLMPKAMRSSTRMTGVELDGVTARIAGALYPQSNIVESGFDKLPMPEDTFDMAIGNPPFGSISLRFQYNPKLNGKSIHNQFFLASMDAVRPEGLQVMVVSRFLMDAKTTESREALALNAELLGAIRLPGSAFKGNAGTSVVTDILFLRKRSSVNASRMAGLMAVRGAKIPVNESYADRQERRAGEEYLAEQLRWTKTGTIKDPLGGEPMEVSQYYVDNPKMIAGVMDRSGSQQHDNDLEVKLPASELAAKLDSIMSFLPEVAVESHSQEVQARTDQLHKALGESLSIMASGREVGSIYYDENGELVEIIERVAENGRSIVTKLKITANSPWSAQLAMNMEGKWFKEAQKLNAKGEKVKFGNRIVMVREVFAKESDIPATMRLGENRLAQLKKLVEIRELYVQQINMETNASPTAVMEANRAKLRGAYESFTKEHGYLNDPKNVSIISEMPDEGLILSLELKYRPPITLAKAKRTGMKTAPARAEPNAILSRAVSIPRQRQESAASISDAAAIVLGESGKLDPQRIATLRGLTEDEAVAELTAGESPLAYMDPETNEFTEKNQYLSGNVRRKLQAARDANLGANVRALEAIQPEPWSSDKVTARLGATWVPPEVYTQFVSHLLDDQNVRVTFSKLTNVFDVHAAQDSTQATSKWGTGRMPAPSLLRTILNSQRVVVYDTDSDGSRHLNETETQSANDKKGELVEEFNEWIFKDADRRQELTQLFNDLYNTRVNRQYDGSHMTFPGKVPDEIIRFRRNQINAIWRGVVDRFTLYDHAVGAGKTFTGISRAIERRRMGLSRKPMIVVPNHLVSEWATQAYRLYPGAKILAAGVRDLEPRNRRRLFAKIAAGEWDIVIVPHSSFKFIGIAPETEERYLEAELRVAQKALQDAEAEREPGQFHKPLSVKAAEALIKRLDARMDVVRGKSGKDKLLTFEQMGVDDLTVDESHEFKNLAYTTRLTDVRGLGPAAGSQKAFDLYTKMRVLHEGGGSGLFMSGTPISNSAVEMYTIMRYLAPEILNEHGLEHFDAYRAQFVDATEKMEPTEAGNSLKVVNRLGREWSNMRALMDGYYSVADVVTNEDIQAWYREDNPGQEFPLPKVKGGKRKTISVQPTPGQQALLEQVIAGYEGLSGISDVMERNNERLRLMTRARKVSLHARVLEPSAPDEPGSKLDRAVDEAMRIYKQWNADRGTQLFFLDRSVPKTRGDDKTLKEYDALREKLALAQANGDEEGQRKALEAMEKYDRDEIAELRAAQAGGWNAYQHMAELLVSKGVPRSEIAFIQNYNSDAEKKVLFEAVNDGSIRFLFGSSQRMGAGMNVQERLVGLHHVDVGWKPSDIEQREGRIIRQGNALLEKYGNDFEVEILAYVTERSIDAKMWDLNSTKLRMVNGIRYYDGEFEMDFEDGDAIDMAEIAAIASGDPLMLERIKLNTIIEGLNRKRRSFNRRREGAEDLLRRAERDIATIPGEIEKARALVAPSTAAIKLAADDQAGRTVLVGDIRYNSLIEARAASRVLIDAQKNGDSKAPFSLEVDGKAYKSEDGVDDALADKMGDVEPFIAEIDGQKVIRRTTVARKMRAMIGDTFRVISNWTTVGTMYGMPLSMKTDSMFGSYVYAKLDVPYGNKSESVVMQNNITPEKHKRGTDVPVNTVYLRSLVEKLSTRLQDMRTPHLEYQERQIKDARGSLPGLREAMQEKFKHADDLDKALLKLQDVEAQLAARALGSAPATKPPEALSAVIGNPPFEKYQRLKVGSRHLGQMGFNSPDASFARGPTFYSALQREVSGIKANAQGAPGWAMNIAGLVKAGKVKQDEADWSGVLDFLKLSEGKVTKEQVTAFLSENGVRVEETVLGGRERPDELPDAWTMEQDDIGNWSVLDEDGEVRGEGGTRGLAKSAALNGIEEEAPTKFGHLQLPGGTNYREILLTLPEPDRLEVAKKNGFKATDYTGIRWTIRNADGDGVGSGIGGSADEALRSWAVLSHKDSGGQPFRSGHWDQPNVLAHIRLNDRTDADGKRVLFVEELQSDWGQSGKKKGFSGMTPDEIVEFDGLSKKLFGGGLLSASDAARRTQLEAKKKNPIPTAPFVTKTNAWLSLALKRIIKMAADEGYDRVAFVNGEQSAERYDLSKHVDQVSYGDDRVLRGFQGRKNVLTEKVAPEKIEDHIGKEVAKRLLDAPMEDGRRVLLGESLKVGGAGMVAFYDKIVPSVLKDVLRKVGGGALETVEIEVGAPRADSGPESSWNFVARPKSDQLGFTITPAIRDKSAGGLPLFDRKPDLAQLEALLRAVTPTNAMGVAQVRGIVSRLADKWTLPVKVVASPKDLPIAAPSDARGLYMNGTVYVVASTNKTQASVLRTLGHEAIAHHGLIAMLGREDWRKMMDQIQFSIKAGNKPLQALQAKVRAAYLDENGRFTLSPRQEADEMTAAAVEEGVDPVTGEFRPGFGWLKAVFAKVAQFLRDIGISVPFSNLELQGALVASMRNLERGARQSVGRAEPAFSRAIRKEGIPIGAPGIASYRDVEVLKAHADYKAAKAGDGDAAIRLVSDLVTDATLEQARHAFGKGAIYASPMAEESAGDNMLPATLAARYAVATGGTEATGIVQTNRVYHTGAKAMERMINRAMFDGPVTPGGRYVLVDDVSTMGSTLAELADHIAAGGGKVIGTVVLADASRPGKMQASIIQTRTIEKRYGDTIRQLFRSEPAALTAAEAGYVLGFPDADALRNRAAKAEAERADRLGAKGVRQELSNPGAPDSGGAFARGGLASVQTLRAVTGNLKDAVSPIGTVSLWDKTVGTQFNKATKDRDFKRVFDAYLQQTDDTAHYAIEAERAAPDILMRLDSVVEASKALWKSGPKHKADLTAVSRALFANIEGEEGVKSVRYDDQSLRQIFNLTPKQISMYYQARAAVDTSIERLAQTYAAQMGGGQGMDLEQVKDMDLADTVATVKTFIQDQHDELRAEEALRKEVATEDDDPAMDETRALEAEFGGKRPKAPSLDETQQLLDRLDAMQEQAVSLQEAGYMPAMRFGEFAVTVTEPATGEVLHFEMFESKLATNLAAMRLRKEYSGATIEKSALNPEQYAMFKGVSPETVALFAQFTGADQSEAYQKYIALAKSARSVMKRQLQRKGIAGFSEDATRVLASFITSNARQSAGNMNIDEITAAMASKSLARKGDVQREAQKLHEYMANPIEEARRLRGFMFMHFLGGSVASALVNLTQPVMQTAPYLAQFSGARTAGIMARSARMAATGNISDPDLKDAVARAAADGITEPHEIHQLMADASGSAFGSNLTARAAVKLWGSLFSNAESFNRRITFIAAYQVAQETGQVDPYAFARTAVYETQGIYAKVNRPNWARGAVGATLFTFKQFTISYLEWWRRLPPKQKGLAFAFLVLAAGTEGLPFADDIEDLIDTIGQTLGYNTNSKKTLRKAMQDILGPTAGTILNTGLLSMTGVDVAGRLGMGNLLPGTAIFKPSETNKTRTVSEFAGPLGGLIAQAQLSIGKMQAGDLLGRTGAAAQLAPRAVRNALEGGEMMASGVYRDTRGYKVDDVTAMESFGKMLGLQPASIATKTRRLSDEIQDKSMVVMVEAMIASRWASGISEKDPEMVQSARDALLAWNRNNPDTPIAIKPIQILRRVREMNKTREERFLKTTPREMRASATRELQP